MADLSAVQWEYVRPFVEQDQELRQRPDGRGGRWGDARRMLNGVLWVLRTGAPWQDLPSRYGAYQSCHRRFQQWVRSGVMRGVLEALAEDLRLRGGFHLHEAFIDGSFAPAKRGALVWAKPSVVKGPRSWQWQTALAFLSPFVRNLLRRTK